MRKTSRRRKSTYIHSAERCGLLYIYILYIKVVLYLANTGFEPTPTSTAAPSNPETTFIPTRPIRSLKRSYHGQGLCSISLHYPSDRVTRFRCANTIIYLQGIPGSYGYRSLEIIYTDVNKKRFIKNVA